VNRVVSAAAGVALGLALLAACGDDGRAAGEGYCEELKVAQKQIDAVQSGDFGSLREAVDGMRELADQAPAEIREDWRILVEGVDRLVDAVEAAGLSEEELAGLQSGEIPDGVDMEALEDLMAELQGLATPGFQKATENIGKHADDECGVDLFPPDA
jgi:hypothetical protein